MTRIAVSAAFWHCRYTMTPLGGEKEGGGGEILIMESRMFFTEYSVSRKCYKRRTGDGEINLAGVWCLI